MDWKCPEPGSEVMDGRSSGVNVNLIGIFKVTGARKSSNSPKKQLRQVVRSFLHS
jgi:hypothetical protein